MDKAFLLSYVEQNYSIREIASACGSSYTGVRRWFVKYGLSSKRSRYGRKPAYTARCANCKAALVEGRKFCSSKCQGAFTHGRTRQSVLSGAGAVQSVLKRIVVEQKGHLCEICKQTEWCGKEIPLVLDHIDGNSENKDFSNLRLVCGNCDMQLPTYKSKNRGKGRFARRQRYAEGKSY